MISHGMLNFYANGCEHTHKQNEKTILYCIPDVQNGFLILYEKYIYNMKFRFVRLLVRIVIQFIERHSK